VIKLAEAQMNAALKQSDIDLRFGVTIRDSANDPATSGGQLAGPGETPWARRG
jgi:hypothetical protein